MTILEHLKAIRDIGVPVDMPPEESKYIRASNIIILGLIPLVMIFAFISLTSGMKIHFFAQISGIPFLLFLIYLNKIGRSTLARAVLMVAAVLTQIFVAAIGDKGDVGYYVFAPFNLAIIMIFSKKETKVMYGILILNIIGLVTALWLKSHLKPLYTLDPSELTTINRTIEIVILGSLIIIGLIVRSSILLAEQRTLEQKERTQEQKENFYSLTEKLKAYLPHQLVEKLVSDKSTVGPDYRRRRLTIFFSDVQGFTKWTDNLEPEEVRELLNNYLSEMSDIARKWGGTIDKFIGDCLMIFFGDPEYTNDKDHAIRCVKMAIEMQEKMNELRYGWRKMVYDEPLNIRIGINTGWATVGNFGSEDRLNYTALGSAVNLASRIESACTPDKITVSHTTYLLIEDEIVCEPKGTIDAKGFAEPVKIYEVVGLKKI